jgi:3-dehydroquinate dehydratase/shikimate dehydrogenase
VRQPDGSLSAFNTDWEAAINAIEEALGGPGALRGKTVVVLGAGGAGKAIAFGAIERRGNAVFHRLLYRNPDCSPLSL